MAEDKRNRSPKYFLDDPVIVASGHERAGLMGHISLRIGVATRIAQGLIANETWMKNKVSDAKTCAYGNEKEAATIVKEAIVNDALEIADALIFKCKSESIL